MQRKMELSEPEWIQTGSSGEQVSTGGVRGGARDSGFLPNFSENLEAFHIKMLAQKRNLDQPGQKEKLSHLFFLE